MFIEDSKLTGGRVACVHCVLLFTVSASFAKGKMLRSKTTNPPGLLRVCDKHLHFFTPRRKRKEGTLTAWEAVVFQSGVDVWMFVHAQVHRAGVVLIMLHSKKVTWLCFLAIPQVG